MIGILATTYNRPDALYKTLGQLLALQAPILLVDDGSDIDNPCMEIIGEICEKHGIKQLYLPENRGLAAALNIGIDYWLADKNIDWISYFQDDVEVNPKTLEILSGFHGQSQILTGHDAKEHPSFEPGRMNEISYCKKWAIRATHIHAHREFWKSVMPIPTRELGAPKRQGSGRGLGSNVDWWIVRDSPNSCQKTKQPIICVPGLVRTFLWKAEDSCWNNTQKAGEDAQLAAY
jgi:glycosyltransferase involved in cell wall biosynthesis